MFGADEEEQFDNIKRMDELNLEEKYPSPFQVIEGVEEREKRRLEKEGRLKVAGDESMMTRKQYEELYGNYIDDCSIIVKKMR